MNLTKTILPGSIIGIIGGGQLGRMMAIEARKMGYKVAVLDPTKNCPCGQIADIEITATYNDLEAIKELASVSDVITYEFENIDYQTLKWLEEQEVLLQKSNLLLVTQDRETEKDAIENTGCKVAPYNIIHRKEELASGVELLGFPVVLKTCRGGYDGKGQLVIRTVADMSQAETLLTNGTCILEKWIPFTKEISVIVTRSVNGETTTFPVAENIHRENILYQSIVPARIEEEVSRRAKQIALQIADSVGLVGTLAVEMFLTEDNDIYINELAPRPHNSGHYSIDFCETNQFEQHVRAICNLPLGNTKLLQSGVMVNILGEDLSVVKENVHLLSKAKLHLYGKAEPIAKRKMGHMNIFTNDIESEIDGINKMWNKEISI